MSLFIAIALLFGVVADDFELPPEIIFSSSTVTVTPLGFQAGDHMRVVVSDRSGAIASYWTFDPLLDYFIAEHMGETVTLNIQDVETYLMTAEAMVRLIRVTGARAGDVSFEAWRSSLEDAGGPEAVLGNYFSAPYEHLYEGEQTVGSGGGR